jgi:hypothetical protein
MGPNASEALIRRRDAGVTADLALDEAELRGQDDLRATALDSLADLELRIASGTESQPDQS